MKYWQRGQRSLHFSLCNSWPQHGHQRQYSPAESPRSNGYSLGVISVVGRELAFDSAGTGQFLGCWLRDASLR